MPLEHSSYRGCIQNAIGPKIKLFQSGGIEAPAGFFIEGTEAFDKQAFQDRCGLFGLAFESALLQALLETFLNGQTFDTGDVGHFGLSFNSFDSLPEPLFERIRQTHHPVEDGEKVQYALPIPTLPVERTHQIELGLIPGLWVAFGLTGAQMCGSNQDEGVGVHIE